MKKNPSGRSKIKETTKNKNIKKKTIKQNSQNLNTFEKQKNTQKNKCKRDRLNRRLRKKTRKKNKKQMKNRSNRGPYRRLRRLNSGLKSAFSLGQCFSSFSKFFLQHQHCPANLIFLSLLLSLCFLFVFFCESFVESCFSTFFSVCFCFWLFFGLFFTLFFLFVFFESAPLWAF